MNKILIFFLLLIVPITSFSGELETREEIKNNVRALFTAKDYNSLNNVGYSYLKDKSRTSSGLWKLSLYYVGLSGIPNSKVTDPHYWKNLKEQVQTWSDFDRKASFPHMIYVNMLISEAWMYRGSGWAREVREEDWKPFREKIEEARLYLEEHSQLKSQDPRWYENMLTIAKAQNWNVSNFYKLLDEALDAHPQFYEIYFRAINYLQPRWHGSVEEIEEFANYAINKSRKYEGNGMYARIYWYVSQEEYGHQLFTKSKVRWEQMKLGIDDVIDKYPDQWNINNFALFSCLANDKKMTNKLINIMEGRPIINAWRDGRFYEYCKEFGSVEK